MKKRVNEGRNLDRLLEDSAHVFVKPAGCSTPNMVRACADLGAAWAGTLTNRPRKQGPRRSRGAR